MAAPAATSKRGTKKGISNSRMACVCGRAERVLITLVFSFPRAEALCPERRGKKGPPPPPWYGAQRLLHGSVDEASAKRAEFERLESAQFENSKLSKTRRLLVSLVSSKRTCSPAGSGKIGVKGMNNFQLYVCGGRAHMHKPLTASNFTIATYKLCLGRVLSS